MASTYLQNSMDLGKKNKANTTAVLPPINSPSAQNEASSTNLNKVLVLTKTDLDRITNHLNKRQKEEEDRQDEIRRKKELHEKSLALTRNWNNTIEGSRRMKLEQKKIREDKLEEKRRQVDLEHAEYMAEERKKAIEKAKLLQYHETDRIKTFHSALKLTEVLKERDAQIEMKKVLDKLHRDQEEEIDKQSQMLLQEKYLADEEAYRKKVEETRKLTEYHKKQIEKHTEKLRQQKDEKSRDAEMLKELHEKNQLEMEQLEEIRLKKMRELKSTYDRMLANKQRLKEFESMMDEEENEEIRVYAAAKKKMAIMRNEKEKEVSKQKQQHRDRMQAYLGTLLKQQVEDEDFRIAKEVAKNEAKLLKEEQFKDAKFRRDMAEIHKHRIDTIKRKETEQILRQKEEEELMKQKMETDYMYHMYELEKSKQRHDKQNQISKTNLKIAKDRKDLEQRMRNADKEFVQKDMELLSLEDKQFEDYATRVISYMEDHGRNTYPMKKVLNESVKPAVVEHRNEASIIKKHQNDVPTNKNLGFL